MQCRPRSHSRLHTVECLSVTACSMDQYAEEKRTEKNLIVRSVISEAETTNNKCIGDDTKAAARQSLNCIKNKTKNKILGKTIFNMPDGIFTPCNVARSLH